MSGFPQVGGGRSESRYLYGWRGARPGAWDLRAYTINAARQDFAEEWKGTVEAGWVADLCVLDRPLLGLDPHAITDAEVDLTVFDGRIVHER